MFSDLFQMLLLYACHFIRPIAWLHLDALGYVGVFRKKKCCWSTGISTTSRAPLGLQKVNTKTENIKRADQQPMVGKCEVKGQNRKAGSKVTGTEMSTG